MKRVWRLLLLTVGLLAAVGLWVGGAAAEPVRPPLTILFTHDTHDHFLPVPGEGGGTYGGYTRLATALEAERSRAQGAVITVDAGDFSMGSLFQTIYATDAPELRALGAMGFDATTLGNHEFDYRQSGLTAMLTAAKASGDPLPAIVETNYTTPADPERGAALAKAFADYPVTDYTVLEREGVRVAVFGVFGVTAHEYAPMSDMSFEPMADAARRVVAEIREKEDPDYIVCLSHAGTSPTPSESEDELLAKAVPGIDVIISGHTHSTTETPIRVNDTLIVSSGEYTQNLGVLKLQGGGPAAAEYRLVPLDDTVAQDPAMVAMAMRFQSAVESTYLADYGLGYDEVLASSPFDFTPISRFGVVQEEDSLGNLIADSYIYAVKEAEGADYIPVDFAVTASGVIRGSIPQGKVTTADAFNVLSLGVGADGTPGYPLISAYLTGRELRDAFEVDASVTPLMGAAQLYGGGMTWAFNPHRMIFNKVSSCAQVLEDGSTVPLENDRLYRVVTGLYCGQMLGAVKEKSFGFLRVAPKDADGVDITDLEAHIVHGSDGAEVKEWYALASYLQSMGTVDEGYAGPEGRKVVAPSWNPIELLKNPNWITLTVAVMGLAVLVGVAALVRRLVYGPSRRKNRNYRGKGR